MGPLGTWTIDINANSAPVIADIKQVETALKTADATAKKTSASMHELGSSGRNGAQGLLALGQAVDDLQYGFKSIVNNIPQIVYMMGGSAGVAGAVGIAAVAVNQLINHWDQLEKFLTKTAPFEAARGAIVLLKEALDDIDKKAKSGEGGIIDLIVDTALMGQFRRAIESFVPAWERAAEAAKRHADAVKETEDAIERISKIRGREAIERGGAFSSAISAAGGGEAMAREMADKAMAGRKFATAEEHKAAREEAVNQAFRLLGRGEQGEQVPMQAFPQKLRESFIDKEQVEQRRIEAQGERNARKFDQDQAEEEKQRALDQMRDEQKGERNARKFDEDALKEKRQQELEQIENERKGRKNAEQYDKDQAEKARQLHMMDLQDKKTAIEEQAHAQLQSLGNQRASQIIQGAKASLDLYQTSSGGSREEQANKIREASRNYLKSIDAEIKKQQRKLIIER